MNPQMDLSLATVFASPLINFLTTKVLTYCSDEIALVCGVKGELKKLAKTLQLIDAVLLDAEARQVENNRLVKLWLGELKDVAYDAQDILAELQYKLLRQRMKKKTFEFGFKIAHKIKDVNTRLDALAKDMKRFNFINQLGGGCSSNAVMNVIESSSQIKDSAAVLGREDDLSKILDLLIDSRPNYNQENYSVVRITGMGGIGKTTLAQILYAKADHFKIKLWVSVSRKSNDREIFWDLLEPNVDRQSSLNATKDRLKDKLKVGKCLIVLDDVWINQGIDVEELLKDLLSMSCAGSKILITMRSLEDIPPMTDCRYIIYQLQGLLKDDCWSIIKKTAFGHGGAKETLNLISIGKQIATKCGGLPLAAKTLGGLLYSKKNEEEWLSILNGQNWNLPPTDDKIISILKLSYDHLSPSYVKQCFSYCSIFPKGHEFLKKELIRMWMAEGFLINPWQANASPETLGNEYFNILLRNSFFQDERRNKWGDDIKSCRMHDLVHDLAILIAGSECQMVRVSSKDDDPEFIMQYDKVRRLGYQILDDDVSATPLEIYKASKLHTFISLYPLFYGLYGDWVWIKQIFSLSLLRVLNLSYSGVAELPQSICKLKHLRYLDLSHTKIKTFPTSFSQLYNLQTLRLKVCDYLKELPKDIRKLVGLEYLLFSDETQLTQMPRGVSRLSKLKKLSFFVVGVGKGYGIEELEDLNLLGGKLVIKNLERVTDATRANLMRKKKITHLRLYWDSNRISQDTAVVMNGLQPHPNLKKLEISHFAGSKFPTWMMTTSLQLPNLVYITLYNCGKCEHLPAFGGLQSLRILRMESMDAIKQIGTDFYGSNEEASFPSLVELYLHSFLNLEEWLGDQPSSSTSSFSSLEILKISDCPKLSTTPTRFPSLEKLDFAIKLVGRPNLKSLSLKVLCGDNNILQTLVVSDCNEFVGFRHEEHQHYQPDHIDNNFLSKIEIKCCSSLTVLPAFSGLNSLTYLKIEECSSLQSLPDGIQHLPALQTLIIGGFSQDLISYPFPAATGDQYFVSLCELTICGWPTLRDELPDELQLLTSLRRLNIRVFPWLLRLPEWFGEFSSLQTLGIENCSRLEYLPSEEQMLRLTSLKILNIRDCPLLLERCRSDNEELHKIAHLKRGSSSSPPLLEHITRDEDMNKELLARRRVGIFSNQNKEKCWIDSSRRNCFMMFPRSFQITWGDDTNYWAWHSIIEPSASGNAEIEVPELVEVCWLTVNGKLDISRLSPGVNYEVVFVVMFREDSQGWDTPVDLWLVLPDGQRIVQKVKFETMLKSKWIEIHVGDFETPQQRGDKKEEVHFWLLEQEVGEWKRGLVIEGAIIRPKK